MLALTLHNPPILPSLRPMIPPRRPIFKITPNILSTLFSTNNFVTSLAAGFVRRDIPSNTQHLETLVTSPSNPSPSPDPHNDDDDLSVSVLASWRAGCKGAHLRPPLPAPQQSSFQWAPVSRRMGKEKASTSSGTETQSFLRNTKAHGFRGG